MQSPLQPPGDVLCTGAYALPLLVTRGCLVHTGTLSKLVCESGNYIPGGLTTTLESGQTGSWPVFARGNRFFLNVKGSLSMLHVGSVDTWPRVFSSQSTAVCSWPLPPKTPLTEFWRLVWDLAVMPGRSELRLTQVSEAGLGRYVQECATGLDPEFLLPVLTAASWPLAGLQESSRTLRALPLLLEDQTVNLNLTLRAK